MYRLILISYNNIVYFFIILNTFFIILIFWVLLWPITLVVISSILHWVKSMPSSQQINATPNYPLIHDLPYWTTINKYLSDKIPEYILNIEFQVYHKPLASVAETKANHVEKMQGPVINTSSWWYTSVASLIRISWCLFRLWEMFVRYLS